MAMSTWTRKSFDSYGLTQHKPGPHLSKIQELASGWVVLCIDISGSMYGSPIEQACAGARRFLSEAAQNGYRVALLEWHHDVGGYHGFDTGLAKIDAILARGLVASGGNDIVPTLTLCEQQMADLRGDRVVAIFGDGDLGSPTSAQTKAASLQQKGIRILTLGLGEGSATALNVISTEELERPRVVDAAALADGIAGLAGALRRTNHT
jgi:hypothetical protein